MFVTPAVHGLFRQPKRCPLQKKKKKKEKKQIAICKFEVHWAKTKCGEVWTFVSNQLNENPTLSTLRLFFHLNSHGWFAWQKNTHAAHPPGSLLSLLRGDDGLIKALVLSSNSGTDHTHSDGGIRMLLIRSSGSGVGKNAGGSGKVWNIQGQCAFGTPKNKIKNSEENKGAEFEPQHFSKCSGIASASYCDFWTSVA